VTFAEEHKVCSGCLELHPTRKLEKVNTEIFTLYCCEKCHRRWKMIQKILRDFQGWSLNFLYN